MFSKHCCHLFSTFVGHAGAQSVPVATDNADNSCCTQRLPKLIKKMKQKNQTEKGGKHYCNVASGNQSFVFVHCMLITSNNIAPMFCRGNLYSGYC